MAWIYLIIAGLFEMGWAIGLKYTQSFTKLVPSIFTIICMIISLYLLSLSLKTLPIGTAYTIWTGIGAIGTVLFGMLFLGESREWIRIVFILFIVVGVVGLKVVSGGDPH
ncbi:DMT family transporter [Shimazuella alba]|uniref:Quaternary ammonium compound efflux SMR transporter SugE n=1 Tax=Shimazuella alba TaxID=2690964 RepID=A0A6I4VRS3_9BACL|nr:quaternary ammonium compound efflux SMR transporter SugE [Shimazuella alba]MXQ52500.1 quaternary ammonium compound efflux SMR transporter SugE [Shimazuella alba]